MSNEVLPVAVLLGFLGVAFFFFLAWRIDRLADRIDALRDELRLKR